LLSKHALCFPQVAASTGHDVTLVDVSKDVLDKSSARIGESIRRVAKKQFAEDPKTGDKFVAESIARLSTATSPKKPLETADLVVEAVVENLEVTTDRETTKMWRDFN
jgi:3-hydroxyacyl-CoA dehydrogenase